MNWRELEAELVDIARLHDHDLDEAKDGDRLLVIEGTGEVNITLFAKALADRLNAKAVKVKANDLV